MKRTVSLALAILALGVVCAGRAQSPACSQESWKLVAELYAFAVCYPDQFPDFVMKSRAKYPPGGTWQKCGERLGNALMSSATPIGDRREMEERAYDVAARAGAPEFGGQVADSLNQTADSPALMGLYLMTYIKSALEIQAGNPGFFTTTDIYQLTSQAWQLAAFAMGPGEMEKFRKAVHDMTVVLVADYGPKIIR